jgi:hypothetical protein
MFEIRLEDLRKLGRRGGATARLHDGTVYTLTPFGAKSTLQVKAIITGREHWVTQEKSFSEIKPEIRTIKLNDTVVARYKDGKLLSTGRGYRRDKIKKDKFKGTFR